MTKDRLELLTDDVLLNLADKIGIKVKDEWSRGTLIQTIIDVMEEERVEKESLLNYAVSIESKKYSVTVNEELDLSYDVDEEMVLPERYNENMVHLLLRDNSWGFILLDIKNSYKLKYQNEYGQVSFVLRVFEAEDESYDRDDVIDFFDIEIEDVEKRRYVSLPHEEAYYYVELLLVAGDKEILVTRSQIVKTSRDHVNYIIGENENLKKIVTLSGFSNSDPVVRKRRHINRILPMDSLEGKE